MLDETLEYKFMALQNNRKGLPMGFVQGERLRLRNAISSLKHIKRQFECQQEFFQRPKDIFDQIDETIKVLIERMLALPLAHRYEGEFYIKKPGTKFGPEFEKVAGAVVMKENLSTWSQDESVPNQKLGYSRNFYKEPAADKPLKRDHGVAIF